MRMPHVSGLALSAMLCLGTAMAAGRCIIQATPPISVTMRGLRPTIVTEINGIKARFIIDTGAFYSALSPAAAAQYKLPLQSAPSPDTLWGMATESQDGPPPPIRLQGFGGGVVATQIATVKTFTYLGVPLPNVQFLVGGNDVGAGAVGLLGDNLLRIADTEYDFRDGMMRLVKLVHCGDRPILFWAKKGRPVAVVKLQAFTDRNPHIIGRGSVNGDPISILFDTGAQRSILSLAAARRAGITPHSPGVVPAGRGAGIAGDHTVRLWRAPIADLQIGTEKIEHTYVLIGHVGEANLNVRAGRTDMLVGEDFFLSHRIFVSYRQRKLYFTYIGGPMFDLGLPSSVWKHSSAAARAPVGQSAHAAGAGPVSAKASAATALGAPSDTPANAAALMHRGRAYAAQREFRRALSDLGRACRLAPRNAQCRYVLGTVYWQDKQPDKALKDFDAALQLAPDDYPAHLARAEMQLARKHWPSPAAKATAVSQAKADLDAVASLIPPESDARLTLGGLYDDVGQYQTAIRQIKLWSRYHAHDIAMTDARDQLASAWNNLCWRAASRDAHLADALRECKRALHYAPRSAAILDSTALVNLRLGKLDRAVDDYDAALKHNAHLPTSLYGRGLAELREGEKAKGRADLSAAEKLDKGIARRFSRMGLSP